MTTLDDTIWETEPEEQETTLTGQRVRFGVHPTLETAADDILFGHLRTITSRKEKDDILTPWKLKHRYSREVYPASGVPDESIHKGMCIRVLNRAKPYLNSRDGLARATVRREHSIAMRHYTGTTPDA